MMNSSGYSLADIAAATGSNNHADDGYGFGGGWAWWIIILLIFGWGGNGWGFGGNRGNGSTDFLDSALQRGFDNQSVISKLDGISNGICNLGYDQLAQLNGINQNISNGFHGVDNAICNLGYQTQQGFNSTNIALMQGQNALQSQLAQCCCDNREGQAQIRYDMATNACAIQNTMNNNTRDLLENQNSNTRALLDFLTQDKIATLQAENSDLKRAASQDRQSALLTTAMASQTQQLINAINPAAIPAYVVPNPNTYYGGCNGYNNGCC